MASAPMKRIMRAFKMNEISAVDRPAQAHARVVLMKRDGDVQKHMYDVSRLAEMLDSIAWMVRSAEDERTIEGDASEVPESLRAWLSEGISAFQDMAQEEVDELIRGTVRKNAALEGDDLDFVTIGKRFFSAEQRRKDAASGAAMKDGSFPIHNEGDLRNAERLAGHAKNPSAARAHIRARAKALGLKLSDSYSKGVIEDILAGLSPDERVAALRAVSGADPLHKENAMTDAEKAELDRLTKALAEATETNAAVKKQLHEAKEEIAKLKPAEDPAVALEKMAESNPAIAKMLADQKKQDEVIKSLQADKERVEFEKRATDIGLPAAHGEVLRKAYAGDAEAIGKLEAAIKGLTAQVDTGKLFGEFGTTRGADVNSPESMLKAKADAYKTAQEALGKKLSDAQAFTHVYTARENADLKKAYDAATAKAPRAA